MSLPSIDTGYKPEFGLGALYQGFNAGNADQAAKEEILKQFLANQREQSMQPLDVNVRGMESDRATMARTPEMLDAYRRLYMGQADTTQAAGNKAMQTWQAEADTTNQENKLKLTRGLLDQKIADLQKKYSEDTTQLDTSRGSVGFPMSTAQPTQSSLQDAVLHLESRGNRFGKNGKLLEGPRTKYGTAKGEMQVLDSTNSNPGYGIVPAADDSPDERARVGKEYIAKMYEIYGDNAKALAAYNYGPGNLNAAIAKARKSEDLAALDPQVPVRSWMDFVPAETRKYVTEGLKKVGEGADSTSILQKFTRSQSNPAQQVVNPLLDRHVKLPTSTPELDRLMGLAMDTPAFRQKRLLGDDTRSSTEAIAQLKMDNAKEIAEMKRNHENALKYNEKVMQAFEILANPNASPEQKAAAQKIKDFDIQRKLAANPAAYSENIDLSKYGVPVTPNAVTQQNNSGGQTSSGVKFKVLNN